MYASCANECGGQIMKGLKVCFCFLITQSESAVEAKPGMSPLNDVPQAAQAAPMLAARFGKQRHDSALFDAINIFGSAVGRVAHITVRAIAGPATRPLNG